jgi:hypothetical protein
MQEFSSPDIFAPRSWIVAPAPFTSLLPETAITPS